MVRLPPAWILLTPGDVAEGARARVVRLVAIAAAEGLAGVVLREPGWGDRALLETARELRSILAGGWLCVHDRVHVGVRAGADAVHLGWRSLAPREARGILPDGVAVGYSSHAGFDPALLADCDYAFFGPVRETPSKRALVAPTGFDGLARAAHAAPCPLWALGGIRPADAPLVLRAGAAGCAVLGGIAHAADPRAAARDYAAALRAAGAPSAGDRR